MKTKLLLLLALLCLNSIFSQTRDSIPNQNVIEVQEFEPHKSLLDSERWKRVSPNRFECSFLRLAVELENFKYHLIEMDGGKRTLIQHENYRIITKAIMKLTLRSSAYIPGISTSASN